MAIMKVTFASEVLSRCIDLNVIVPMETLGLPGTEATEKRGYRSLRHCICYMDMVVIRMTG